MNIDRKQKAFTIHLANIQHLLVSDTTLCTRN